MGLVVPGVKGLKWGPQLAWGPSFGGSPLVGGPGGKGSSSPPAPSSGWPFRIISSEIIGFSTHCDGT